MAILQSHLNPPKIYALSKSGIALAVRGAEPVYKSIPDLMAEESLKDIQRKVEIEDLSFRLRHQPAPPKVSPERNTVLFLGIHKPYPKKTTVFDNAQRQSYHDKRRLYRKFQAR